MTNRTHTAGIPAISDAIMLNILLNGFSDQRGNRRDSGAFRTIAGGKIKRIGGRIGRTESGWWHKDTADMSAERLNRRAANKRADDKLLAEELRALDIVTTTSGRSATSIDRRALDARTGATSQVRKSKRPMVMRDVEVIHVKTMEDGTRLVLKREVQQFECRRARKG